MITLAGSGFDSAPQAALASQGGAQFASSPLLVSPSSFAAGQLVFTLPANLPGAEEAALLIFLQVYNSDAAFSNALKFLITFRGWIPIGDVAGAVPGFKRGGNISDETICGWISDVAQSINSYLLRRGISLSPADWTPPAAGSGSPEPIAVLGGINKLGAASLLAAQIGAQFQSGEYGLARVLERRYNDQLKMLADGAYDKVFRPTSGTTIETGTQVSAGDMTDPVTGDLQSSFSKGQVF